MELTVYCVQHAWKNLISLCLITKLLPKAWLVALYYTVFFVAKELWILSAQDQFVLLSDLQKLQNASQAL